MKTLFPLLQKFVQKQNHDPASHKYTAVLATIIYDWQIHATNRGYTIGKLGRNKIVVDRIATPLGNLQAMLIWVEDQTRE